MTILPLGYLNLPFQSTLRKRTLKIAEALYYTKRSLADFKCYRSQRLELGGIRTRVSINIVRQTDNHPLHSTYATLEIRRDETLSEELALLTVSVARKLSEES